jgi:hypothetical protein
LDQLPPSADFESIRRLGRILRIRPTAADDAELRAEFFSGGFSWQGLIDFASMHQLLPATIWALRQRGLLLPLPSYATACQARMHVTDHLLRSYEHHLRLQHDLRDQLLAIIAACNRKGILPLVIKGARHLLVQEHWWVARGMRDLDILVHEDEVAATQSALDHLGYHAEGPEMPGHHHLPKMIRSNWNGAVEIHLAPLAFNASALLTTSETWAFSKAYENGGTRSLVLPAKWHVVHGLLHHQMTDRGHERRVLALKGLWEFAMGVAVLSPAEVAMLDGHLRGRGRPDVLPSWIEQAGLIFGLAVPEELTIPERARAHARATLVRAGWPYALRRALFIADQLRFAFSPATLASRYGGQRQSTLRLAARHVGYLQRTYRSGARRRIFGDRNQAS